ncbi:hypothetical protein [Pseudomonas sp. LRF_L74]|uniref:hypothetical protein n=1 Tax=Pseudomonas sp. LRF_L74 TaxID=3369422 RepID=UPI003F5DC803
MTVRAISIQWRISLLSGLCLLAVVASLLGTMLYQTYRNAQLQKRESIRMLDEAAQARLRQLQESARLGLSLNDLASHQHGLVKHFRT